MTETGYLSRAGIVDRVEAVRNNAGEVLRLNLKVRAETEFQQLYYKNEKHVDELTFSVPVDSGINPGDLVAISMQFANPIGQRFVPALEASTVEDEDDDFDDDEDDDVLEVMVEEGLIEEVKSDG